MSIALLAWLLVAPSAAQTNTGSGEAGTQPATTKEEPPKAADRPNPDTHIVLEGAGLESVLGREVRTKVDEEMGRIVDVLADPGCQVKAAVIEFGGFLGIGTRKIAVEWSALRFDPDSKPPALVLDMTREQLRDAPEYKPRRPAVTGKPVN